MEKEGEEEKRSPSRSASSACPTLDCQDTLPTCAWPGLDLAGTRVLLGPGSIPVARKGKEVEEGGGLRLDFTASQALNWPTQLSPPHRWRMSP